MNKICKLVVTSLFLLNTSAYAEQAAVSVKQIGASFLEAPPGREKNLVPMGSMNAQEKVETHLIATFKNRLITDMPFFSNDSKVSAIAILSDKSTVELGPAEVSSFRKVSEDRKKTLISVSVSRLPDKPVAGIRFSGSVKVQVAISEVRKTAKFEAKVGSRPELGIGQISVAVLDANSFTLSGGEALERISAIKITKADGSTLTGQRGALSRQGETDGVRVQTQWTFPGPVSSGKLDITMYDALETVDVPVSVVVAKPY
ncbi:hypothetical protein [Undibacterium sp. KW1]|uniref:hypothetical protein n=1 Tax=Undibacterium sp. KW1 TaxID=2058624 RepID=UPI00138A0CB4|nr:hypothetical protein [Undibacterium sp. KW1]